MVAPLLPSRMSDFQFDEVGLPRWALETTLITTERKVASLQHVDCELFPRVNFDVSWMEVQGTD